jgi:hypothetical protein
MNMNLPYKIPVKREKLLRILLSLSLDPPDFSLTFSGKTFPEIIGKLGI